MLYLSPAVFNKDVVAKTISISPYKLTLKKNASVDVYI